MACSAHHRPESGMSILKGWYENRFEVRWGQLQEVRGGFKSELEINTVTYIPSNHIFINPLCTLFV